MDDSPLFVLHGNGTVLNRGCEAIAVTTVNILRREFPGCELLHASYPNGATSPEPAVIEGAPVIPWVNNKRYSRGWFLHQFRKLLGKGREPLMRLRNSASAVLSCGGDLFTLDYGSPVRRFETAQKVLDAGCPFILWGASVGPFTADPTLEKYAAERLKRFTLICARESATVEYLAGLGVEENVRLVADPAFTLEPRELDLDREGLGVLRGPCIGLNFSPLIARYHGDLQEWASQAAGCIRAVAKRTDLPVLLIPHVFTRTSNDLLFLRQIHGQLCDLGDRVSVADKAYTSRELKYILSRLHVFAGARTHATIGSISSGVPTLSISYSQKAVGINKDIFGHTDWTLSWREATADLFSRKICSLLSEAAAVREHLGRVIPAFVEQARLAAGMLREHIRTRR